MTSESMNPLVVWTVEARLLQCRTDMAKMILNVGVGVSLGKDSV